MEKLLFDADFKKNLIGQQINLRLLAACKNVAENCKFLGISQSISAEKLPSNVDIKTVNLFGLENIWRSFVPGIFALINKDTPFYFPCGNIASLMPANTPVISLIRDIMPLTEGNNAEEIKLYKRKIQTDINRSDLVFVLSENLKNKVSQEFLFMHEPIALNFASLIPDEYIELPMARINEKYFFVDVENVSPKGLSDLLKVFIYYRMKDPKATKLYLSGNLKLITQELLINLEVARKVDAIREYKNLTSEQRSMLLRGALAAILPAKTDILPFAQLDAMKCSCPVITDSIPSITEACANAAIYADITDADNFKMLLLRVEQDAAFRNEYIYKGLYREKSFTWNYSAKIFLENIENLFK